MHDEARTRAAFDFDIVPDDASRLCRQLGVPIASEEGICPYRRRHRNGQVEGIADN